MNCPIDGTNLQMMERQGIEIDYCPQCRGVWLDRGELDKLIERSHSVFGAPGGYGATDAPESARVTGTTGAPTMPVQPNMAPPYPQPPPQGAYVPPPAPQPLPQPYSVPRGYDRDDDYDRDDYGRPKGEYRDYDRDYDRDHRKRKRRGFLDDIFDFD